MEYKHYIRNIIASIYIEDIDEAGRDEEAETIGNLDPMNIIEDFWSWKITDKFEDGMLQNVLDADSEIREKLVDGQRHINEKDMEQKRKENYWD